MLSCLLVSTLDAFIAAFVLFSLPEIPECKAEKALGGVC